MSHHRAEEVKEAAEHAKEHRKHAPVSLTIAIFAVLVATVTLMGHRSHTDEVLLETKVTDQWAYYQAKNMRLNNVEALDELLAALKDADPQRAESVHKSFHQEMAKYTKDKEEIAVEARKLEKEVTRATREANRYDLAEVFLEIALVVTSITLLTDKPGYWYFGIVLAAAGVIFGISALFIR